MFDADSVPQDPPAADDDPAVLRAENRLRALEEMREICLEVARVIKEEVVAASEPAAEDRRKVRDLADGLGAISRAFRLTVALETKTDEYLRDLKAGVVRERAEEKVRGAERARVRAAEDREARIERVRDLVLCVAETEVPDLDAFDKVFEALDHELELDEVGFGYATRPLRESVERLCADLGLDPDWNRWTDEGWNLDDVPVRPGFDAFRLSGSRPRTSPPFQPLHNGHDLE
jgi:hypothetical protein